MSNWTIRDKEEAAESLAAGERLAAARRAQDIPIRDIAKELHLDEPKVRALEENRFDDIGAAVFAKGHLRKYAELVGVPADEIISDYDEMNLSATLPPVVGPKHTPPREFSLGRWIAAALVILLLAAIVAAAYWFVSRNAADDGGSTAEGQSEILPEEPAAVSVPLDPPDLESAVEYNEPDTPSELPEATFDAAPVEPAPVTSPPVIDANADAVELTLSFSGECWTEVSDASGRRLFFDLGRAGRRVTVSGAAPLRVLLGNSNNVSLQVDGVDYAVDAGVRRGNTATLTIPPR